MENSDYTYIGCFFDPDMLAEKIKHLPRKPLYRTIPTPHATFIYRPSEFYEELFGQEIKAVITGYGQNGENEGLSIRLYSENETLKKLIDAIKVPHITLSVSKDGESVNTKFLEFKPIEEIEIVGVFGGYKKP